MPPTREEKLQRLRDADVVLVSACLIGEACRYDGRANEKPPVARALEGKSVVPVCPEAGAGLGIPRPAVELEGGTGVDVLHGGARAKEKASGVDRTEAFLRGAKLALQAAQQHGATVAILKERSPSCGTHQVYRSGTLVDGQGVTARLLMEHGITVLSDEDL